MQKSKFEKGIIVISIDDGDADGFRVYENILKKYRLSATYNIVTGLVGDADRLTKEQIQILHNDPFIEIAAHGHTHQNDDEDISKCVECLYDWLAIENEAIGFASPGSPMRADFIEENADHLRSLKLLYVRTSKNNMPSERHQKLQEMLKAQGAPQFVWENAGQITYRFDGLAVNSAPIYHDTTVEDMKKLVELAITERACVVLMFHRFRKPGEAIYEGRLCYDYDSFAEFAEYLSQMRDAGKIDVLTNEQAYRLGRK